MSITKNDVIAFIGSMITIYAFIFLYLTIQGVTVTLKILPIIAFTILVAFLVFCGFSTKPRRVTK